MVQGAESEFMEGEECLNFGRFLANPPPGEEVVISGMAGYFPESNNMYELRDNLFSGVQMYTDDERRWKRGYPRVPQCTGKVKDLSSFDASFFGFHNKQVYCMCPTTRVLLERTYEAIVDAGVNPLSLKGTKTGVYMGSCFSETEKMWMFDCEADTGYPITGSLRAMVSARITHWLGVTGPSLNADSACSSALFAMNHAYEDLRLGKVDYAVVVGSNMVLDPYTSQQFSDLGVLSPEGVLRSFDQDANGYVRSDSLVVAFLQRANTARRVYCTLVHSKVNCDGYKPEGITFPATQVHRMLFHEFYQECGVDPNTISYIEAHATGTKVGDPEELNAVEQIFCKDRKSPLLIGSVKSNLGHSEPVSGLCSLGKVVITMETGVIPANLNFKKPKSSVLGFGTGKFKVVCENTPLPGDLIAMNSFGFGGANAHLLLRRCNKVKTNNGAPRDSVPRLVVASGRTEEAVNTILDNVESMPVDAEFVSLLHELHAVNTPGHLYRGYILLAPGKEKKRDVQVYDQAQRPLWLFFCDNKQQWSGIGKSLLQLPKFAATIQQCDQVLRSEGIDIMKILSDQESSNVVGNAVANIAVQLALVDVLSSVGITPDGILGHSTGELVCAYADGCLTLQQVLLAAYHHAVLTSSSKTEELCKRLQQVVSNPKQRSSCWASSVVPESEVTTTKSRLASPEYLCDCLLGSGSVETLGRKIPDGALVIEIAPRRTLNTAVVRRVAPVTVFNMASTEGSAGLEQLLIMFGELYEAGVQPQLVRLYPAVQYPVSRGTPMISPLVRWDHAKKWPVYEDQENMNKGKWERLYSINVTETGKEFYTGHMIDGRVLYPATGYLLLAWETFSKMFASNELISVVFKDVRFLRATTLPAEGNVEFVVSVQKVTGQFEVAEGGTAIVTGRIRRLEEEDRTKALNLPPPEHVQGPELVDLTARDIYKELRLRGYQYSGVFRGLVSVDVQATKGSIQWNNNWVGFMDTILQMRIMSRDTRFLYVPTMIDRVVIDVEKHKAELARCKDNVLPIVAWDSLDLVRAGGVELQRMGASAITRRNPLGDPVLERYQFVPHRCDSNTEHLDLDLRQATTLCVHLVLENHLGVMVKALELASTGQRELLVPTIAAILGDLPLIQAELGVVVAPDDPRVSELGPSVSIYTQGQLPTDNSALLVTATDVLCDSQLLHNIFSQILAEDGCLLVREAPTVDLGNVQQNLQVVFDRRVGKDRVLLLRKKRSLPEVPLVVDVTAADFSWLPALQAAVRDIEAPRRVVLVAQGDVMSGILGLFNCIRKEPGGELVRCFFIVDEDAPRFDPCLPLYAEQLALDLAVNVLRDGVWGSYRHLALEPLTKKTALHGYNNLLVRGDLSSVTWIEGHHTNLDDMTHPVHIYYSALNFRDIMLGTGKISPDTITSDRTKMDAQEGFEFSGRDENGVRVMGMTLGNALANLLDDDTSLLWRVPDRWSLEEAATVPVVYATAIYALKIQGRLQAGDTVLIHAGSGGVGQAAINYCLFHGCTVYTTVGTQEKRDYIKKQFPQLTDDHIGNSRDTTFEQLVMRQTNGRGVDMVLNSLAEEKLQASIRCLARGGRFLEIGKFDLSKNSQLVMDMFDKDQSFHAIMLDLFMMAKTEEKRLINNLLQASIQEGSVRPLERSVFDMGSVEQAFRFMAAGKHVGKVLVKIRPEEEDVWVKPTTYPIEVIPRFHCDPKLTYIVLGGLGGFGLELTDWLVLRGARNIVLTSRKGITTGYQSQRVHLWRSYGVRVVISTVNVSTVEGATSLLTEANNIAPVGGIFNLAVVLRDALLENQTQENFQESFRGKATATRHLDAVSRRLCPSLKQFVVFSSVSCGRGNAGQTNYGMANSVMERICEARARDGLPALAVQWGAVGEVGLVAEMQEEQHELVIGGTLQQRIASCLDVMGQLLKQPHPVVASMVVAEKRAAAGKFTNIVDCVANILGLRDIKTVSGLSTLTELGMDSMMAVEIKQAIEREFQVFLTPQEIRNLTIKQLQELATSDGAQETTKKGEEQVQVSEKKAKQEHFIFNFYGNKDTGSKVLLPLASRQSGKGGSSSPVFLVPGMEGTATTLEELTRNIVAPCLGAQLCYNNTSTTIPGMAAHLLKHMRKHLPAGKPFMFVGHSFGGLVALEMAAALEAEGGRGHVFLLDASPDFTYQLVKQHLMKDATDQDTMQITLLYRILHFVAPTFEHSMAEFTAALKQRSSLSERIQWMLQYAPEGERDYQSAIVHAIFTHINAIMNYSWAQGRRLSSDVTLIRPSNTLIKMDGDCGLSKVCQKPAAVHFVEGDHTSMLQNPQTAEIINQVLQG